MFTRSRLVGASGLALALFVSSWQSLPAQEKGKDAEKGIVVQARGPVHEGFAAPQDKDPTPSVIIPKKPPDPIPEEPPDQRPKGDNVQWIPGYWAWDTENKDFLWVSGFWRVPPPDRKWVPGHWTKGDGGWQWVPGFWGPNTPDQLEYLPEPPDSVEVGPSTPAPGGDSFYLPGAWRYQNSEYAWQPGFWTQGYPGWVWNSAGYRWTPSGYVFVNGYWDYPLADRGLLFAPVYFQQPLWATPGWYYRPRFVVGIDGLFGSLFIRPGYGHYYFGDYYDPSYIGLGFYPWCSYGSRFYDPLFGYYRWAHRGDRGWLNGLNATFVARRDGLQLRPPRTLSSTAALPAAGGSRPAAGPQLVTPLGQNQGALTAVSAAQLTQQRSAAQQVRTLSAERNKLETAANFPGVGRTRESFYYGRPESFGGTNLGSRSLESRAYRPPSTPSGLRVISSSGASMAPSYRGGSYSSGRISGGSMHFSGGGGGRSSGGGGGHSSGGGHR